MRESGTEDRDEGRGRTVKGGGRPERTLGGGGGKDAGRAALGSSGALRG